MSDVGSPAARPADDPVDDGQEQEYQDAVAAADSDRDEDALSEVDENLIEDYDPEAANIEDRPVDIDEDVARTLKASKRKRLDGEVSKKRREGRREKKRRDKEEDIPMDDADVDDSSRKPRRSRRAGDGERRSKAKESTPARDEEEDLSPEERRKRAIDRALDAAIKKPSGARRKKKDEIVRPSLTSQGCSPMAFIAQAFETNLCVRYRTLRTRSTTCWQTSRFVWRMLARQTTRLARTVNRRCTN